MSLNLNATSENLPKSKDADDFVKWLENESTASTYAPSTISSKISESFESLGLKRSTNTARIEQLGEDDILDSDLISDRTIFSPMIDSDSPLYNITPYAWIEKMMEGFHLSGGLPWSTSILLGCHIVRLVCLKLDLTSERYFTRQMVSAPKEQELFVKYKLAKARGDVEDIKLANKLRYENMKQGNVPTSGRKTLNFALQLSVIAFQVSAVDRLSVIHAQDFMDSSFYWISHLALPDPQGVLPVVTALSVAVMLSHHNLRMMTTQSSLDKLMIAAVHGFSFGASYIIYLYCVSLPAHINLVLAFNIFCSLILKMTLCAKPVRKILNLPNIQGSFTTNIFRNSIVKDKRTFAEKAEASKGRLRLALHDLRMVFKDPEKIRERYRKLYEHKKLLEKSVVDQQIKETKKT
uniref:Uncharacterized protein n=1 Tax=Romanomermis culicivorax TaxID=13658 RepID=A0A915JYW5_ROMCU